MTLRPRTARAEALVTGAAASPAGKRAAFSARGDIVTVPAENGAVINVTQTSGVAERYPAGHLMGRLSLTGATEAASTS